MDNNLFWSFDVDTLFSNFVLPVLTPIFLSVCVVEKLFEIVKYRRGFGITKHFKLSTL